MQNTGVLIAAAGMSSRMGAFKPLLPLGDETLLSCQLKKWIELRLSPIVIVTGNRAEELEAYIWRFTEQNKTECRIVCIRNEKYQTTEMFTSLKLGMEWLKEKCDGFLVIPADIPLFSIETVRDILAGEGEIRKPVCHGRGGHPLFLHAQLIEKILSYQGEEGLKGALQETGTAVTYLPVEDEGILLDADTMADYRKMTEEYRRRNGEQR